MANGIGAYGTQPLTVGTAPPPPNQSSSVDVGAPPDRIDAASSTPRRDGEHDGSSSSMLPWLAGGLVTGIGAIGLAAGALAQHRMYAAAVARAVGASSSLAKPHPDAAPTAVPSVPSQPPKNDAAPVGADAPAAEPSHTQPPAAVPEAPTSANANAAAAPTRDDAAPPCATAASAPAEHRAAPEAETVPPQPPLEPNVAARRANRDTHPNRPQAQRPQPPLRNARANENPQPPARPARFLDGLLDANGVVHPHGNARANENPRPPAQPARFLDGLLDANGVVHPHGNARANANPRPPAQPARFLDGLLDANGVVHPRGNAYVPDPQQRFARGRFDNRARFDRDPLAAELAERNAQRARANAEWRARLARQRAEQDALRERRRAEHAAQMARIDAEGEARLARIQADWQARRVRWEANLERMRARGMWPAVDADVHARPNVGAAAAQFARLREIVMPGRDFSRVDYPRLEREIREAVGELGERRADMFAHLREDMGHVDRAIADVFHAFGRDRAAIDYDFSPAQAAYVAWETIKAKPELAERDKGVENLVIGLDAAAREHGCSTRHASEILQAIGNAYPHDPAHAAAVPFDQARDVMLEISRAALPRAVATTADAPEQRRRYLALLEEGLRAHPNVAAEQRERFVRDFVERDWEEFRGLIE